MEVNKSLRKNTDYSNSAVNLTNPSALRELLEKYHLAQTRIQNVNDKIKAAVPQILFDELAVEQDFVGRVTDEMKRVIEAEGSYQDIELGQYALKQRKVSVSYDAARFEYLYPQYAPAIIVKAVDAAKLKGLIKGGLLNEEDLKHPEVGIAKETESFAYIIRG